MQKLFFALIFLLLILFFTLLVFRTRLRKNLEFIYVIVFILGYLAKGSILNVEAGIVISFIEPLILLMIAWVGFATGFQLRYLDLRRIVPGFLKIYFLYYAVMLLLLFGIVALLNVGNKFTFLATIGAMDAFVTRVLLRKRSKFINTIIFSTLTMVIAVLLFSLSMPIIRILLSLGFGILVAFAVEILIFDAKKEEDFLVVFLGLILLVSALFHVLSLSPVLAIFIAGVIVANISIKMRNRIIQFLQSGEQIIFFLFLFLAGYYFAFRNVTVSVFFVFVPLLILIYSGLNKKFNIALFGIHPLSVAMMLEFFYFTRNEVLFSTFVSIFVFFLFIKGSMRFVKRSR